MSRRHRAPDLPETFGRSQWLGRETGHNHWEIGHNGRAIGRNERHPESEIPFGD